MLRLQNAFARQLGQKIFCTRKFNLQPSKWKFRRECLSWNGKPSPKMENDESLTVRKRVYQVHAANVQKSGCGLLSALFVNYWRQTHFRYRSAECEWKCSSGLSIKRNVLCDTWAMDLLASRSFEKQFSSTTRQARYDSHAIEDFVLLAFSNAARLTCQQTGNSPENDFIIIFIILNPTRTHGDWGACGCLRTPWMMLPIYFNHLWWHHTVDHSINIQFWSSRVFARQSWRECQFRSMNCVVGSSLHCYNISSLWQHQVSFSLLLFWWISGRCWLITSKFIVLHHGCMSFRMFFSLRIC